MLKIAQKFIVPLKKSILYTRPLYNFTNITEILEKKALDQNNFSNFDVRKFVHFTF